MSKIKGLAAISSGNYFFSAKLDLRYDFFDWSLYQFLAIYVEIINFVRSGASFKIFQKFQGLKISSSLCVKFKNMSNSAIDYAMG